MFEGLFKKHSPRGSDCANINGNGKGAVVVPAVKFNKYEFWERLHFIFI
jgi:hypothetical protein